jgi:integrase
MRSTIKLTDKIAREASTDRPSSITFDGGEGAVKGLGLRVTKAGAKAWVLNYRTKGSGVERRLTIGGFPAWPAVKARARAAELRQLVDQGEDPLNELREQRAAPTVAELVERYEVEHLPRKREESQYEDRNLAKQWIIPELGRRKVAELKRADIDRLFRKVSARTPTRANRLLSLLSMLFTLAVRWEMRPDNPAKGIERNAEHARARYLTVDEIGRLMAAIDQYRPSNPASADAIELLLLTGARRGEVLSATWSQFDLDAGVWIKPAAGTKQNREHRVPLSPEAVELLRRRLPGARLGRVIPLRQNEHVFPGGGEKGHQVEIRKAWLAICQAAGLDGVRLHDLRHSYASLLVSAGRSLPEIGALLGHRQVQTTARYSHLFDEPLRQATGLVGKVVGKGRAAK